MTLRICIVSEALRKPLDEGVKLFVYNLIKELSRDHRVLGLSRTNSLDGEIDLFCRKAIPRNKLFLSIFLQNTIRKFKPDIIYYIPTACATTNSFIRARILKWYGKGSKLVMITLQPREYSSIGKLIIPLLMPDLMLAQSAKTRNILRSLGCRTEKIMCGVDLEKFVPGEKDMKESLRSKYGFPDNQYIVLHVGHINKNRNAHFMVNIQNIDGVQAVVVGSASYPEDKELVQDLREKGVIVITSYIENIQEIYQCADCYVFPVLSEGACIEIPLSIFEALACDLPVVTTKFGGLPDFIDGQAGFEYVDGVEEIPSKIEKMMGTPLQRTRNIAEQYSWKNVASQAILAASVF